MGKFVDITGKRFGSLVAVSRAESYIKKNGQKVSMWNCLCDCGEHTVVAYGNLQSGNVKSCGNRKNHRPQREYKDLTGKRFGKLTVIERGEDYVSKEGFHRRRWRCKCDCGNIVSVIENGLHENKSCGCGRYPDLIGKKFEKLTVMEKFGVHTSKGGSTCIIWKCECECGNTTYATTTNLTQGHVKSCGCWKIESQLTHGMTGTRLYRIWNDMRTRCYNKSHKSYKDYGGRGITVCDEWKEDSNKFIEWSLRNGYAESLSLDRKDTNGNYEPSNCRWSTRKEQANNTRRNVFLEYNGKRQTITQWAEELGINNRTLQNRIKRGWSIERALETK